MENWAIFFATLVGPIIAVLVTRVIDKRNAALQRKYDLFVSIMKWRGRIATSDDAIGALNAARVIYSDVKPVAACLSELFTYLNHSGPSPTSAPDELARFEKRTDELFTTLLTEMAISLNLNIPQVEILNHRYTPSSYFEARDQNDQIRKYILQLLTGKSKFPVSIDGKKL